MNETAVVNSNAKTNAILAWLFSPITSFIWKDDNDPFLKSHARESLYLGVANILVFVVIVALQFIYSFTLAYFFQGFLYWLALLTECFWTLLWSASWAFVVIPRAVGMIKAANSDTWEIPMVSQFMSKYIK